MPDSEAVAILFSCDPENSSECNWDIFRVSEGFGDPIRAAEQLRDSCKDDFPTRLWSIAANDQAREIMSKRRMREWGMDAYLCQAYTERSVPLARSGRRHQRCKHEAVTKRTATKATLAWTSEREVALCGIHAKMWDEGRSPRLESDER